MAEFIDIFDANLRHLGKMERTEAHLKGEWHQTFHCWVVNLTVEGGAVLFQLRSSKMVNFPDLLDVSAAGHLGTGEKIEDGIREVTEELGIPVQMSQLYPLGYRIEVADQSNGQRNREFQMVYLIRLDRALTDYKPDPEELAGLFWLSIDSGLELFGGRQTSAHVSGVLFDGDSKQWVSKNRLVTVSDFLPRIQRYYLTILIMADRLREGRMPLGIS